jgi:hypothetical protein
MTRDLIFTKVEFSSSFDLFQIEFTRCHRKFRWDVSIFRNGEFDVTPHLQTMEGIPLYDPYANYDKVMSICRDVDSVQLLRTIAAAVVESIESSQKQALKEMLDSQLKFTADMLIGFEGSSYFVESCDCEKMFIDVPILWKSRLSFSDLEYLADVTEQDPVKIAITISRNLDSSVSISSSIKYPVSMPCSRFTDVPKWNSVNETITDYIHSAETAIYLNWRDRQSFVKQLESISATYEFDAVDFSYVAFVIRVKMKNMFSMCSVEVKFHSTYPKDPPQVILLDMQTSLSSIIDPVEIVQSGHYQWNWPPERLADELYLFCYERLYALSFGQSATTTSSK